MLSKGCGEAPKRPPTFSKGRNPRRGIHYFGDALAIVNTVEVGRSGTIACTQLIGESYLIIMSRAKQI